MRRLIAGMKLSLDGKFQGPEGYADWVEAWSEDYGLTSGIDACLVGGGMYPGYEGYWSAMQKAPGEPLPMTGQMPTAAELEWARFAEQTPHYVLSTTLNSANWPNTTFLRSLDAVAALKKAPGKDIYVMGGGRIVAALLEAGFLDELRVITYPVIAGAGVALFSDAVQRHALTLKTVEPREGGRHFAAYAFN